MTVIEAVRGRRSVRRFLRDKPIPDDALEALIDAIIWAPSAGNLQARFFYFIFGEDIKKMIAAACLSQMFIASAPLVVVACADLERISRYGKRGKDLYCVEDTAVAVENLMLQAHELGLGSVWVGAFHEDDIAGILDIPANLKPLAVVPVGYPAYAPGPPGRLSRDEAIKVIR